MGLWDKMLDGPAGTLGGHAPREQLSLFEGHAAQARDKAQAREAALVREHFGEDEAEVLALADRAGAHREGDVPLAIFGLELTGEAPST